MSQYSSKESQALADGSRTAAVQTQSDASDWAAQIAKSPRMVAQSRRLSAIYGPAIRSSQVEQGQQALQQRPTAASASEVEHSTAGATLDKTGIPDPLKAGIEALSGIDLSAVRVHANSNKPAQLNARAYAHGNEIHLGPGQERDLPHEAWHVVQQVQGRVRPTIQTKSGIQINDDEGLEREADVMGARAAAVVAPMQRVRLDPSSQGAGGESFGDLSPLDRGAVLGNAGSSSAPVQGVFEWVWPVVGAVAGFAQQIGNALGLGGGNAVPPVAPPVPIAVPAVPAVAPIAPALPTPVEIRQRLLAAEQMLTTAAGTLPIAIRRGQWAQEQEPTMVANVQLAFANVQHLVAFPLAGPGSAAAVDAQTALIEQAARNYRDYCAAVGPNLEQAVAHRAAYLAQLSLADTVFFTNICTGVEQGNVTVVQTQMLCTQFIERTRVSSARTSDALHALMMGNKPQAEQLVQQYFASKRLRLGSFRGGYKSDYDPKTGQFGAEWTLKARNADLKDIADNWVFHTHATCDPAFNFTIGRQMGQSHIKREQDAMAVGVSLNFVDVEEFERVERDSDARRAFEKWVHRSALQPLSNTKKRQ